MANARWRHLDLRKPAQNPLPGHSPEPEVETPEASLPAAMEPAGAPLSPALQQARALYVLQQFEPCADLLRAALAVHPEFPGARRLLGLALGRLDLAAEAAACLRAACREAPGDAELEASRISAEIRANQEPGEAPRTAAGALAELAGAGAWARGQHALRAGRAAVAADSFREAGEWFAAHSPADTLAERVAAAYIGEAVSNLAAGRLDLAQRAFSRLRERARLPEATLRFARGLYELAEALRELEPRERAEELGPLVEAVLAARLRVRFYDGTRPVEMYWENLP